MTTRFVYIEAKQRGRKEEEKKSPRNSAIKSRIGTYRASIRIYIYKTKNCRVSVCEA